MKPQSLPPKSLRENALRLIQAGQPAKQIATTLHVPIGKIYYWRRYYLNPLTPPEDGRQLYDEQFKQGVLDQLATGVSVSQLARGLGVSKVTLFKWKRNFNQAKRGITEPQRVGLITDSHEPQPTIEGLLERIRVLEEEKDVLKKALQIFMSAD